MHGVFLCVTSPAIFFCYARSMEQPELIDALRTAVAFPSIAGNTKAKKEAVDWVANAFFQKSVPWLRQGNIQDAPYLFVDHPEAKALLFAHFDVVPAPEAMFSLRVDGDRAHGRGVKDMKGAFLPVLFAYREWCEEHDAPPPVSLLVTSDEEIGGHSIPALFEQGVLDAQHIPVACTPDAGEGQDIIVEHKGAAWIRITANGRGSHGAYPWRGDNPIVILNHALRRIAEDFPALTEPAWKTTATPTKLTAGFAINAMPDKAECTLDVRFPKEAFSEPKDAHAAIARLLPASCTCELIDGADPLCTDEQHALIQTMKSIIADVTGLPIAFRREHGATDARHFGTRGIPAFIYGPEGGRIHTDAEWVSVDSLMRHGEIAKRFLNALAA